MSSVTVMELISLLMIVVGLALMAFDLTRLSRARYPQQQKQGSSML